MSNQTKKEVFASGEDFRRRYFPDALDFPVDIPRPATNDATTSGTEIADRLLDELAGRLQVARTRE